MEKYKYKIVNSLEHSYKVEGVGNLLELPDFVPISLMSVLQDFQHQKGLVEITVKTDSYSYEFIKILDPS